MPRSNDLVLDEDDWLVTLDTVGNKGISKICPVLSIPCPFQMSLIPRSLIMVRTGHLRADPPAVSPFSSRTSTLSIVDSSTSDVCYCLLPNHGSGLLGLEPVREPERNRADYSAFGNAATKCSLIIINYIAYYDSPSRADTFSRGFYFWASLSGT